MNILETQLVQRSYDKNWELIGKVFDTENSYTYENEFGIPVTLTPTKWITLKVYPFIMEIA